MSTPIGYKPRRDKRVTIRDTFEFVRFSAYIRVESRTYARVSYVRGHTATQNIRSALDNIIYAFVRFSSSNYANV